MNGFGTQGTVLLVSSANLFAALLFLTSGFLVLVCLCRVLVRLSAAGLLRKPLWDELVEEVLRA